MLSLLSKLKDKFTGTKKEVKAEDKNIILKDFIDIPAKIKLEYSDLFETIKLNLNMLNDHLLINKKAVFSKSKHSKNADFLLKTPIQIKEIILIIRFAKKPSVK